MEEIKKEGKRKLVFFAIGDWGDAVSAKKTANAMNMWVEKNGIKPSFILALGDNFYPVGVSSVEDVHFTAVWKEPFLKFPALCVPWHVVLGNHDYEANPEAQIEFTTAPQNPGKLWSLPSRVYKFSEPFGDKSVDFFALDTNGAQGHVRLRYKKLNMEQELWKYKEWLRTELANSNALWKIVFAHHPLYTKGTKHGTIGRCIRDDKYKHSSGEAKGYGFESVLIDGGVDAYFSGHEHVMQYKQASSVNYFVVYSGGAHHPGFYGYEDKSVEMNWWSLFTGFAVVTLTEEEMSVQFVDLTASTVHTVNVPKSS